MKMFEVLATILHLGNVIFEEDNVTVECKISNETRSHCEYAALFLRVDRKMLETLLLTRSLQIKGSDPIM